MELSKKQLTGIVALAVLIFLAVVATPMQAITVKEKCFNNTHKLSSYDYSEIENKSVTNYQFEQLLECNNGCSFTLGTCRPDPYQEMINAMWLMGGILLFSVFSLWVALQTESKIDIILISVIALFTILFGAQDSFSAMYRTILFGYAFVPMGILWVSHKVMEKEIDGEPIEMEVD